EIVAIDVSAGTGAGTIADLIERVAKLLAGHGAAVGPVFATGSDLTERVVAVNPIGAINVGHPRALVCEIVRIRVRVQDLRTGVGTANVGQAIQAIVLFGGGHATRAAVREHNLADERRIGKV